MKPSSRYFNSLMVTGLLAAGIASAPNVLANEPDDRRSRSASVLAGTNILETDRSMVVPVVLTKSATLHQVLRPRRARGPSKSIDVVGKGRAVGIVLLPESDDAWPHTTVVAGGRFRRCVNEACGGGGPPVNFLFPSRWPQEEGPNTTRLEKGRYQLHVIADGAPVRIVLRLGGLTGTTVIRGGSDAPVDLQTPPVRLDIEEPNFVYGAGASFNAGEKGILLSTLFVRGQEPQDYDFGICEYAGANRPPDEVAYGPHCSTLALTGGRSLVAYFPDVRSFTVISLTLYGPDDFPPSIDAKRGFGTWIMADRPATQVGSQAFTVQHR